ncbi:predicted protein, partial [Nematostella vectensis]
MPPLLPKTQHQEELEEKCAESCQRKIDLEAIKKYTKKRFPIAKWLSKYNLHFLQCDLIAGLTVGLMVVPQGLAYALVAGLPPQYGLYSAFMGCFVYCVFGTSKDITLGPTAIMSLIVSAYGKSEIPAFVMVLTLLSGVIQLLMGILKLGFLVNFISIPVVSGFTSSAAIIIAISQIKDVLGLKNIPRPFMKRIYQTFKNIGDTRRWDLVLGLICIIVLLLMRKLGRTRWVKDVIPETPRTIKVLKKICWLIAIARNAIVILVASVVAVLLYIHGHKSVFSLTGHLEPGLPPFKAPPMTITNGNVTYSTSDVLSQLGPGLAIVPLIGFLESIAIAKAFARKNRYKVDASQELIALGLANVLSSFVSSYPVTGSFSRTAVNAQSGVATPAGGIFTGAIVILALGVLTPFFKYIPKASLAALIISSVLTMVEFQIVPRIWRVKKIDLIPLLVTFFGCFYEIEYGILAGMGVSLAIFLYPVIWPTLTKTEQDYITIRIKGDLAYTGVEHVVSELEELTFSDPPPRGIILNMSMIQHTDFTVTQCLLVVIEELGNKNIPMFFSEVQSGIRKTLIDAGVE